LENVPDPEKEIDIGVSEVSQLFTFGAGSIRPRRTIVPIGSEVILVTGGDTDHRHDQGGTWDTGMLKPGGEEDAQVSPKADLWLHHADFIPAQNSKAAGYTQLRSTTQIVAASQPAANEV
jgi:hypothetical protein